MAREVKTPKTAEGYSRVKFRIFRVNAFNLKLKNRVEKYAEKIYLDRFHITIYSIFTLSISSFVYVNIFCII